MRPIAEIICHCSDTPPSMDIGAAEIDQWHRARGWLCIGYHFVIRRSGTVEAGRPVAMVGAHVYGHNSTTIGVCLVGSKGDHTPIQWGRAALLVADLCHQFGLPASAVRGHREYNPDKTCPDFDVATQFRPHVEELLATPQPDTSFETGDDHGVGTPVNPESNTATGTPE